MTMEEHLDYPLPKLDDEDFQQKVEMALSQLYLKVLPLSMVENSNSSPNDLTVHETRRILASRRALPSPDFKQRGVVWPFTCSYLCTCSWSVSSSFWRGSGGWTGSRFSLAPHEEGPSAAGSTIC